MTRSAVLVFIYAATASALAMNAGFTVEEVPVITNQPYSVWEETLDLPMITVSAEIVPRLHLEGCYGFRSATEEEEQYFTNEVVDSRTEAFGFSSYYSIVNKGNVKLSAGMRFLHSMTKVEEEGETAYFKKTLNRWGPMARIDFSIPGLESVGFYSQLGIDFNRAETTYYFGNEEETDGRDEWRTSAPALVLSGIYYSFSL